MGIADEVSLRPLSLRPGAGVNPFASFANGAGMNIKNKATASALSEEKRKARGDVVKYPREFLMKFAEKYTRLPTELQFSNLEIVLDPADPEREKHRRLLQRVVADDADERDERDWRSRTPLPPVSSTPSQNVNTSNSGHADANAPKIQRAADLGRTAWAPSAPAMTVDSATQSLRKVKGILNKLTPEKFERLLSQLIPLVSSYDVLRGTIRQVFENAVAQPTFVPMYADLCSELDAALPEFEGPEGTESFKKMLANTCQEEYEATEAARSEAAKLSGEEQEEAERSAKLRLLGNVRLIAELFKKGMVNDRIMLIILGDLLGPSDGEPNEEAVEAACEVVTTAGATLEENARSKARLDAVFAHLGKLANSKTYAPRIRFVIRDVIDLRAQHWVARRETFTAKKLDEIRSEAQAELGIVDIAIPGLEPLIPGIEPLPGIGAKRTEDVELFPAFRDSGSTLSTGQSTVGDGKFSAFLGQFVPITETSKATPPEASGQSVRAPRTDLSEESRTSLGRSLYSDYISSKNIEEAVASAQELAIPEFKPTLIRLGLEKAFDALETGDRDAIMGLIVSLCKKEVYSGKDIREAVDGYAAQLEDLALDVPAAPRVLGGVLGMSVAAGLMDLNGVKEPVEGVESAEPRRAFVASALHAVKEAQGVDGLKAAVKASGINVLLLFENDPEFEDHLPSARKFAEEEGLLMAVE